MAIIGGDLSAMEVTAGRFDTTGAVASDHAASASAFARSQHGEYESLATALVTRIHEVAESCSAEADRMRSELEATEWYGSARSTVDGAEAELRTTLRALLDDTGATAEQFKADLSRLVASYEEQVLTGRLAPSMERLRASYADIGRATRRVAEGFRQADAVIGGA